jgi:glucose-1-phosphate thymidylyltransferase
MRGIILAGGLGTRLYPSTLAVSKQLMPVYDKPMIYYPLSVLMLTGIRDILLITTAFDLKNYKKLFGNGSKIGIKLKYQIQKKPKGLVDAFIIGKNFIGKNSVCLILGDNIFYGDGFIDYLNKSKDIVYKEKKAVIFTYPVSNPSDYGIVSRKNNKFTKIIEKPKKTNSNKAVVGLYFYPNSILEYSKLVNFSKRKELEITDLNNIYLKKKELEVLELGRGFSWHDGGSPGSLQDVSQFIQTIEKRMQYKIACIEEIAFNNKWISKKQLIKLYIQNKNSEYGAYLKKIIS